MSNFPGRSHVESTTFTPREVLPEHFIEQGEIKAKLNNTINEKKSVEKKRDIFKGGYDQKNRIIVSLCLGFLASICFFAGYHMSQYITQNFTIADMIASGFCVSLIVYFSVANKILNEL